MSAAKYSVQVEAISNSEFAWRITPNPPVIPHPQSGFYGEDEAAPVEVHGQLGATTLERRLENAAMRILLQKKAGEFARTEAEAERLAVEAECGQVPDTGIPDLGLKLVPFLVTSKLRETVAGDLEEDFRSFATKWGRPYALKWLCWELGGLFFRRFGPTSIIAGIAMWCRQKIGS